MIFRGFFSVAHTDVATAAVQNGARLITHLFNAMPQLHHRDPSIIGLLGASPWLSSPFDPLPVVLPCTLDHLPPFELPGSMHDTGASTPTGHSSSSPQASVEIIEESSTHPKRQEASLSGIVSPSNPPTRKQSRPSLHLDKGQIADMSFERPHYGLIVDGIHCHPNSVRVRTCCLIDCHHSFSCYNGVVGLFLSS